MKSSLTPEEAKIGLIMAAIVGPCKAKEHAKKVVIEKPKVK